MSEKVNLKKTVEFAYDRFLHKYNENPNQDWMQNLKAVVEASPNYETPIKLKTPKFVKRINQLIFLICVIGWIPALGIDIWGEPSDLYWKIWYSFLLLFVMLISLQVIIDWMRKEKKLENENKGTDS